MLLEGKKILIMGIRNKWSIAFGIAKSAYENGAQLLFTYMGEENKEKIEELVSEFKGSKAYVLNGASEDEKVRETFTKIKEENGKIDGIVHAIAHANTEDLHNDFIYTSKEGFAHACDVSAYSFVLIARMAKELDMLNENASLITLTYHGSTKVLEGYNVMGIAKAALESSVRYLAENLGKENIRVNAVSAGPIKTLSAKGIKDFSSILNVVEQKAPLHRNVTTVQVGNVATFLLSSMSEAVTGQVIYADNGYNIMGVAKAALEASVRYLSVDLGKIGCRINAISAGPIKTLSAKGIKDFGTILDVVEKRAPLHRNVTTKEVGDVTAFLFSDLSSAITGEIIHVDNGFSSVGV